MGNDLFSSFRNYMLGFMTELNTTYGYNISTERMIWLMEAFMKYDFFNEAEVKDAAQSILCQTVEEYHDFPHAFHKYFSKVKHIATNYITDMFLPEIKNDIQRSKDEEEERNILEKSAFSSELCNNSVDNEEIREIFKEISEAVNCRNSSVLYNILIKDGMQILSICSMEKNKRSSFVMQSEQELQEVMLYVIENDYGDEVKEAVIDATENLVKRIMEYDEISNRHNKEMSEITKTYMKHESKKHRDIYVEGRNAVQTEKGYMYKDFRQLTDEDFEKIRGYIKRNALVMKTRIRRGNKKKQLPKLDYKRTMKSAARTDMVPMELYYKQKEKKKTKIITIADISGSCKNASQILMTFIYALQEAFPGGVESYVFVKQIADATETFRKHPLKEANERTSVLVERDYSDYGYAFQQFDRMFFHKVTKDSIVIYLGDARNNNNETGEEFLEKIRKRVKTGHGKMLWLNPDALTKWNTGDSIIGTYSRYMDSVMHIYNADSIQKVLNEMF